MGLTLFRRQEAAAPDAGWRERGFALIIVLWFLVLIGSIGIVLILHGRSETAIAHNTRAAANAEALADAGIAGAAFNQTEPAPANRWKFGDTGHRIDLPGGYVVIQIADETRKINPNHAPAALLAGLFEASGVERNRALHLGGAIADWVSPEGPPSAYGAKRDAYRAAGKDYEPPNLPFETLDDLNLVLGMTPDILAQVRPYLTIYTQTAEPNVNGAPFLVIL
jgi:general secretion pathway protein K